MTGDWKGLLILLGMATSWPAI